MSAFYGCSGAPDFGLSRQVLFFEVSFFVSLQTHFVLYTLTERKFMFSYNNKVYIIGFQKVKGHTSKRINMKCCLPS